ncbi:MAG: PAS domain S-box protein [Candidatus Acidiferrales bacterium]
MNTVVIRRLTSSRDVYGESSSLQRFDLDPFLEFGRCLVDTKSLASALEDAANLILKTFKVDACEVLEQASDLGSFSFRALATNIPLDSLVGQTKPHPQAYFALVRNEPLILGKDAGSSAVPPARLRDAGIVSSFYVPIPGRLRPYGAIAIHSTAPRSFTPNEVCVLQSMANGLGASIELHHTDRSLRESHERFRAIVTGSALGVAFFDLECKVFEANEMFCALTGLTREELIGSQLHNLMHLEEVDSTRDSLARLFSGEMPNYIDDLRLREQHQDKEMIWVRLAANVIRDDSGSPLYGLAAVEDITEPRRARRSLERQTAYLLALCEGSPVAIVVVDSDHRVQFCNSAFERLFLYTQVEIVGTQLDEMITTKGTAKESSELTRLVLRGNKTFADTRRRRKDGGLVDVEIFGVPLMVGGKQVGACGFYHDLTERKRAERSLRNLSGRLLRLQDDERRRIARELHDTTGQSLAALSMYLGVVSESQTGLSRVARKALWEGLSLAEQCAREIRTVSYLLHPPLLDELGLVSALRWYVKGFSERSGIRVTLRISPELQRLSRQVETTLFRIVQESLTNIHRHSRSDEAAIHIDLVDDGVRLEIRDKGLGIPKRVLNSDNARTSKLGVGIPGMRERTMQLGGQLEITSSSSGTIIRVTLPIGGRKHGISSNPRRRRS